MSRSFDVVVVGGGGSGLAAAIEAASGGASVCLLEKAERLGGSTARSVGSISAATTREQASLGIDDTRAAHLEDYRLFCGTEVERDNFALAKVLVDHAADTVEWLKAAGLRFAGPFLEPPHRVARLLVALPSARAYIERLERRARSLGVEIVLDAPVAALHFEGDHVVGMSLNGKARGETIEVKRAAILAGGDFSNGAILKRKFHSEGYAAIAALNQNNTGDAIQMAVEAGGEIVNGDMLYPPNLRFVPETSPGLLTRIPSYPWVTGTMAWLWRVLPPQLVRPLALRIAVTAMSPDAAIFKAGALVVNRAGEPHLGEPSQVGTWVAHHAPDGAFIILDDTLIERFSAWPDFISTAPGLGFAYIQDYRRGKYAYHEASTLEQLAGKIGVPQERLVSAAQAGVREPERWQRSRRFAALGPVRGLIVITDGGVRVTTGMHVLRPDGSAMPNLFAVGATGQGGLLLAGHGHHLAWAFVSGRIAGAAAANVPRLVSNKAQLE
jgi:succinate dehydrogenase/fumarate reductase flavoprotein subunit